MSQQPPTIYPARNRAGSRSPGYPAGSDGRFGPTSKKELWNNMDTAGWWRGMKYRITAEGVLETGLSGFDLISFPMLNKGTAFTEDERTDFGERSSLVRSEEHTSELQSP